MALLTLEEALDYLGIDYPDKMVERNVSMAIDAAISTLHGTVGEDVETLLPGDARAKQLALLYMADNYSERLPEIQRSKTVSARRYQVQTMELQLQMELRRRRSNA